MATAFHGDPAIKAQFLTRAKAAERDGRIVQRLYYNPDTRSGCAVGILVYGDDHAALAAQLGIPRDIVDLLPTLHDGMPAALARSFPARFIAAIPVGADTRMVIPRFLHWLLIGGPPGSTTDGVIRFADARGAAVIRDVAALLTRRIAGDEPNQAEWEAVGAAARAAAGAAAGAAARAAVGAAAWEAARAAARAAAYAAVGAAEWEAVGAAEWAAAWAAARAAAYERMADRLIALLADAPVPTERAIVPHEERSLVAV